MDMPKFRQKIAKQLEKMKFQIDEEKQYDTGRYELKIHTYLQQRNVQQQRHIITGIKMSNQLECGPRFNKPVILTLDNKTNIVMEFEDAIKYQIGNFYED